MQNRAHLKKKLENYGYIFKGERILAGFSRRVKNFSCLGKHFHCNWDEKENVIGHLYTPITPAEAKRLQSVIDPVTGEPYVGIAWVKMPWELFEQKEVQALKVVEAHEYSQKKQEELEYADDFEEVVESDRQRRVDANKAAAKQAANANKGSDDAGGDGDEDEDLDLDSAPDAETVDTDTDFDNGGDEDPLADMVTDANGDNANKDMSLERQELMAKNMNELRNDAKELGLKGYQNLRKEELVEAILG